MGLTRGAGPLAGEGRRAPSNFDIDGPAHQLHFEEYGPRLRAVVGGQVVLDTVDARLLHETGLLPVAYAPLSDFDPAALERTATRHGSTSRSPTSSPGCSC
jgi:uncharacterized protein (DUF427 family)